MKTGKYSILNPAFLFLLIFISLSAFAQKDKVIYIGKNGRLTGPEHADFTLKIHTKSEKSIEVLSLQLIDGKWEKIYTEQYKRLNDSTYQIKSSSKTSTNTNKRVYIPQANGTFKFKDIHKDQVVSFGFSKTKIPLTLEGEVTNYYPDGQKKSISQYKNNELISNQNWNENGEKYIDNIFYSVDEDPFYKAGNKVLHEFLLKGFKDAGIDIKNTSGTVLVAFVVMEDGTIDGIKLLKGIVPSVNGVAYESFLKLKEGWKPAKLNGKNVRYYQVFPINFIYNELHLEFAEMRGAILHYGAY